MVKELGLYPITVGLGVGLGGGPGVGLKVGTGVGGGLISGAEELGVGTGTEEVEGAGVEVGAKLI